MRKWVAEDGYHGRCPVCGWSVRRPTRELRDREVNAHQMQHVGGDAA
jgi:hypothetical protein